MYVQEKKMNEELLNEEKNETLASNDNPLKSCLLMIGMTILAFALIVVINRSTGTSKGPEKTETPAVETSAETPAAETPVLESPAAENPAAETQTENPAK